MQSEGNIGEGFVIDGLPRTGSTTLARLLGCHPEIRCLMEPFHPRRYNGQFHQMAIEARTVAPALNLIWQRWSGLKHVWEPAGWPFRGNPALNNDIVLKADRVVFLNRRNLLRRFVSGFISQKLQFWVGDREEFVARLENIQLPALNPDGVRQELELDRSAMEARLCLLRRNHVRFMMLDYEQLYDETLVPRERLKVLNQVTTFLGFEALPESIFAMECVPLLDPAVHRWASQEVYRRLPGIDDVEEHAGSDEMGWLFR